MRSVPPADIDIDEALDSKDVFTKVGLFEGWANTLLAKDEWRKSFNVYENTITALYEASKPEILGQPVVRTVAVFQYLRGVVDSIIQQQDIDSAVNRSTNYSMKASSSMTQLLHRLRSPDRL